jgi:hypothetical protein
LDWVPLQSAAKTKGELVFAMRQIQTPPMTQPGPWGTTQQGYCLGLAAIWISMGYEGKSFPVDGNKVCDNPPWRSTLAQTLAVATAAAKWEDYWTTAANAFNMRLSDGLRAKRETMLTGNFIHSIVTKAYGYYGVTVTGTGGTHAVALRHGRDNRMHFFDANFGHFAVKDHTKLKAFMDWFWIASGYSNNFLEKSVGIVGIRPPIGK